MANALDPTGRDARCRPGWWLDDRGGLLLQLPEPFTRRSESVANRSYAEGLFCSFEQFHICDGLIAAEQPCCSGRGLEFRYEYRTIGESLSQEFCRDADGIGVAGHGALPSPLRGSRAMSDDAALIGWQAVLGGRALAG
jgi:hypothetical protein